MIGLQYISELSKYMLVVMMTRGFLTVGRFMRLRYNEKRSLNVVVSIYRTSLVLKAVFWVSFSARPIFKSSLSSRTRLNGRLEPHRRQTG